MRLASRPIAAIAVVLTIALGLPLATEAPAAAATTISFTPVQPMAGEYTWVRGKLPTRVVRPVYIQYYKPGRGWTIYPLRYQGDGALGRTFNGGRFRFRPRAIAPYRAWRVVAPHRTINGTTYRAVVSSSRRMYTVAQTSQILRFVPAPIGQAKDGSPTNLTPVNTAFTPIRPGRRVLLQNNRGGSWRTIATAVQDRRGKATVNIPTALARDHGSRVIAASYNGARYWASAPGRGGGTTLDFRDNFSGTALDTTRWSYRLPGKRTAKNRACSESSDKSVSVNNGKLILQTKKIAKTDVDPTGLRGYRLDYESRCPHGQFYNGHIGTKDGVQGDFTHGFMAARIRVQPQRGHHGGFWSQPTNGKDPSGAEIDALEYYGDASSRIQHTIYRDNVVLAKSFQRRDYLLPPKTTWSRGYHIFSVEWTPKVYIFRIDGHETFRTSRGVSQTPQYLITSLLSSDYELDDLPASGPYTPMYVDWVRVWR